MSFIKFIHSFFENEADTKKIYIQLDITNLCNLKCTHCYLDQEKSDVISKTNIFKIIDEVSALADKLKSKIALLICGGEPLLFIDEVETIISYCLHRLKRTPEILILTNGTVNLPTKSLDFLKKSNCQFQVSIESPEEDIHDDIRGKGNYKKSVEFIKIMKSHGIMVSIQAVLTDRACRQIEHFFIFGKLLKIDAVNFTRLINIGNAAINSIKEPDKEILKKAYFNIVEYSKKFNVTTNTNAPLFCLVDKNLGMHGKIGFNGFTIRSNGDVHLSSRINYKIGNILEESASHIFNSDELKKIRLKETEGCELCSFKRKCSGNRNVAFAKTGNIHAHDPQCWK